MLRSALVLLQLALVQQACALLVAPRPCAWHAACSEAGRSSSPLMLAKRKGKASRGSSSTPPGDTPPPAAAQEPAGLDVEAAMAQAEAAAAEAAAAKARLAAARARAAAAAAKQQAGAAPVAPVAPEPTPFAMAPPDAPFPVAGPADVADRASFDEKGAIIRDEPKQALPSFESYSRGAPKKPPPKLNEFVGKRYESKLPGINQGSKYAMQGEEKEDGKPPLEKFVFNITWAGIFTLVLIEIFINTPAFQAVKPVILSFTQGGE